MPPTNLFGLGYGVGPAGYGYPSAGTVAAPPTLSYPGSPFAWTQHVPIAPVYPITTGSPTSFAKVGNLPDGVSFSTTTGVIAGTPTADSVSSTISITATGPGGTSAPVVISVGVFTIPDLTPKAWWDNSDLATLWQDSGRTTPVSADGDPRGAIDDKSGNALHRIQATAGKRALYKASIQNGRSVGRYDGTDDNDAKAASLGSAPVTVLTVMKFANTDGTCQFDGITGPTRLAMQHGVALSLGHIEIFGISGFNAADTPGAWHLYEVVFNGASSYVKIDGVLVASGDVGTVDPTGGFLVGSQWNGSAYSVLDEGETVIVTGGLISAGDLTKARALLRQKWGISGAYLAAEGDSITAMGLGTTMYPEFSVGNIDAALSTVVSLTGFAASGATTADLATRAASVDAYFAAAPSGAVKILSVLIGANDFNEAGFTATVKSYCLDRKTATTGLKIILLPILPRTHPGFNAWRNARNAEFLADPTFYDYLVPADASMWDDAAVLDLTKFQPDGTHPTQYGQSLIAPFLQTAIESFL